MEHFCCCLCVRVSKCAWVWNVDFLSLSSLMQLCFLPYASPICFLSSLCFPITSSLFLLNKGKHAISHNGIFSSAVCPWVGKNSSPLCVCVRASVWGMRHSGGLRPEMGVSLVVLPELFSTWGSACERTPALDFAGDCRAECTVFYERVSSPVMFSHSAGTLVLQPCCLYEPAVYGNEDVQMCL